MRGRILGLVDDALQAGARFKAACDIVGFTARTLQRWRKEPGDDGRKNNRVHRNNALNAAERRRVIEVACSPEFRDLSPRQIVPILAENGLYYASESTFYRILHAAGLMRHRSNSRPPQRKKPEELVVTGPDRVWCRDISYLKTFMKSIYYYLYIIMDIWDRSIVGWAVHECESGELAGALMRETCMRHEIRPGSLVVHQDNGSPMISSEFLAALSHFLIAPSYSRPGICDDNPYSESLFKTVKYRPGFPGCFESIQEAREWMEKFVDWYNNGHRHSAIGYVTPTQRRSGADVKILETRRQTYEASRRAHPERWSGETRTWEHVEAVTLNPKSIKGGQQNAA